MPMVATAWVTPDGFCQPVLPRQVSISDGMFFGCLVTDEPAVRTLPVSPQHPPLQGPPRPKYTVEEGKFSNEDLEPLRKLLEDLKRTKDWYPSLCLNHEPWQWGTADTALAML